MDICLNCKGAIMEPGVAYGYSGQICHCPIDPATLYRRSAKTNADFKDSLEFHKDLAEMRQTEITRLEKLLAAYKEENSACQSAIDCGQRVIDVLEGRRALDLDACKKPWEFFEREADKLREARIKLEKEKTV